MEVEELLRQLEREKDDKKVAVIRKLGHIEDNRIVKPLIDVLEDLYPAVREVAAQALAKQADPMAVEPLIKLLGDKYFNARRRAAEALGKLEDKRAVLPLLDALNDKDEMVRRNAVLSLGQIGDVRAVVPLRRLYAGANKNLHLPAFEALAELKTNVLYRDRLKLKRKREQLDQVETLIVSLLNWFGTIRHNVLRQLADTADPRAFPYFVAALFWGKPQARYHAAEGLRNLGGTDAAQALTEALNDSERMVANSAMSALIHIGSPAIPFLLEQLNSINFHIRSSVIHILGEIKDPSAIPPLIQAMEDRSGSIRRDIARAIEKFKSVAIPPLLEALNQENATIRLEAVKILGKLDEISILGTLFNLLKDPLENIRLEVVKALGKLADNRAVEPLLKMLRDSSSEVREETARSLGLIRDQRAVPLLIQALEDYSHEVQETAAGALGRIGDKTAIEPLAAKLKGAFLPKRVSTIMALSRFGDARAVEPLVELICNSTMYGNMAEGELERLRAQLFQPNDRFLCKKCFCYSSLHSVYRMNPNSGMLIQFTYAACRTCHSNLYYMEGINRVIWNLDRDMQELTVTSDGVLKINVLKMKELADFDEIHIIDADDFDVERMVMNLINDTDDFRRERSENATIKLNSKLPLSKAKINLLRDHFHLVETQNI